MFYNQSVFGQTHMGHFLLWSLYRGQGAVLENSRYILQGTDQAQMSGIYKWSMHLLICNGIYTKNNALTIQARNRYTCAIFISVNIL